MVGWNCHPFATTPPVTPSAKPLLNAELYRKIVVFRAIQSATASRRFELFKDLINGAYRDSMCIVQNGNENGRCPDAGPYAEERQRVNASISDPGPLDGRYSMANKNSTAALHPFAGEGGGAVFVRVRGQSPCRNIRPKLTSSSRQETQMVRIPHRAIRRLPRPAPRANKPMMPK